MSRRLNSFQRIWRWPLAVALLITFGLLSALLGQGGVWWLLSWVALAIPLLLIAGCIAWGTRDRAKPIAVDSVPERSP